MSSRDEHFDQLFSVLMSQQKLIEANQEIIKRIVTILETPETGEWIPVKDAALLLNVTPQTVRDWVRAGEVKGKRVGEKKFVVYKPSALARAKYFDS